MTAIFGLLTSRIGAIGAWAMVLALGVSLGICAVKGKGLEHKLERADKALTAAKNDLATCRGNTARLEYAIGEQNRAVEAMKAAGDTRQAAAQHAAERARLEARAALSKLAAFQRRPIKGATACARVDDVAAAILEDMR